MRVKSILNQVEKYKDLCTSGCAGKERGGSGHCGWRYGSARIVRVAVRSVGTAGV